jgi:hypothetical protein
MVRFIARKKIGYQQSVVIRLPGTLQQSLDESVAEDEVPARFDGPLNPLSLQFTQTCTYGVCLKISVTGARTLGLLTKD